MAKANLHDSFLFDYQQFAGFVAEGVLSRPFSVPDVGTSMDVQSYKRACHRYDLHGSMALGDVCLVWLWLLQGLKDYDQLWFSKLNPNRRKTTLCIY